MKKNHRPYAFISYSHKDTPEVLPLIEGIKNRGFHVWYDAGIEAGTEWPEFIGEKLFECNCVIVFLSQNAADSANCRREIDFAVELDKKVLVIYLVNKEEMELSPGLRLQLNNKQAMFIKNSPTREEFLNNLTVAELLKPCRITDEWDTLYPEEEEAPPVTETPGAPALKLPRTEQPSGSGEAAGSRSEEAQLLAEGQQLEAEGKLVEAFGQYDRAAQLGHPVAMYQLAECFRQGRGTAQDPDAAYHWYQIAGEKGVTMAMLRQAKYYEQENGTEKGRKKAFVLLSIAAKLNNPEAMYELGICYMEGIGVPVDTQAGIAWLEAAAKKEFVQAMYTLGMHYLQEGQDAQKAISWLDSAAYWRHPAAMFELGNYFWEQENRENALRWYTLAAERGHIDSIHRLIDHGRYSLSSKEMLRWYRKAAEFGDAYSMYQLAECYANGKGTQKDPEEAEKWYEAAAEAGNYEAMYLWAECLRERFWSRNDAFVWYEKAAQIGKPEALLRLADCYLHGWGTYKDEKEAFNYCFQASRYPYFSKANYTLASYYAQGIGIEKNPHEAFSCYLEAADDGYTDAYIKLAECYESGFGVEADPEKAFQWYLKAAESGTVKGMHKVADHYAAAQNGVDAFAWYQRAAKSDLIARYKLAMCYAQGFGTRENKGEAEKLLAYAEKPEVPDASCYLARFYEEMGYLSGAARYYRFAAEDGCPEAYGVICTARWYRIRRMFNPRWWLNHHRAVKGYKRNQDSYRPILLPWETTKSTAQE